MIPIRVQDDLPFVTVTLTHQGAILTLDRVLLDTGSAGTLMRADLLENIGLVPGPNAVVQRIRGVGGTEFVVTVTADRLSVGDLEGILGFDFLLQTGTVIDLARLEVRRKRSRR